jgi:hypothetical protein
MTDTTSPKLTPPVVEDRPKTTPAEDALDRMAAEPVKALTAAEAAAGLQATVDDLKGQLEHETDKREKANKAIKRIRAELEAAERILRATQPRKSTK